MMVCLRHEFKLYLRSRFLHYSLFIIHHSFFISFPTKKEETIMSEENLYTFENPEYRKTFWHTSSHIMAQAVKRLWPEVQLAIGPAIDEGWYYDFDAPFSFTPDHLTQIEGEMKKIVNPKQNRRYRR